MSLGLQFIRGGLVYKKAVAIVPVEVASTLYQDGVVNASFVVHFQCIR